MPGRGTSSRVTSGRGPVSAKGQPKETFTFLFVVQVACLRREHQRCQVQMEDHMHQGLNAQRVTF